MRTTVLFDIATLQVGDLWPQKMRRTMESLLGYASLLRQEQADEIRNIVRSECDMR